MNSATLHVALHCSQIQTYFIVFVISSFSRGRAVSLSLSLSWLSSFSRASPSLTLFVSSMDVAWAGQYCSCSSDRWLDERTCRTRYSSPIQPHRRYSSPTTCWSNGSSSPASRSHQATTPTLTISAPERMATPTVTTHPQWHNIVRFRLPKPDFPRGHPSWDCSRRSTLNCGVLIGS
jgi:hypothetical protein